MNKSQILILTAAVTLFLILYIGFDKVPVKQKNLEKSRLMNIEPTGLSNLLSEAFSKLNAEQKRFIEAINLDIEKSESDTLKRIEKLKSLSGTWYDYGFPSISGSYAEEIATLEKTEESWSITGTTFAICVKKTDDQKTRTYCSKHAIKAFENAISLAPEKVEPRLNLAMCYVDNPETDQPMRGILMLRDLNTTYPGNVSVLNQLAKLAIQTNQVEKALARLEEAIKLEPKNMTTICLLATAYKNAGNSSKAIEYEKKCVN